MIQINLHTIMNNIGRKKLWITVSYQFQYNYSGSSFSKLILLNKIINLAGVINNHFDNLSLSARKDLELFFFFPTFVIHIKY